MFAKSVSEPIEHGSELNEGEERGSEFIVTSAETTMTLEPAPEVFDAMAATIKTPRDRWCAATFLSTGDASSSAKVSDALTQTIRVEAVVGDQRAAAQQADVLIHRADVITWPRMRADFPSAPRSAAVEKGELR